MSFLILSFYILSVLVQRILINIGLRLTIASFCLKFLSQRTVITVRILSRSVVLFIQIAPVEPCQRCTGRVVRVERIVRIAEVQVTLVRTCEHGIGEKMNSKLLPILD